MKTLKGYENNYSFECNSDNIANMVLSGKYLEIYQKNITRFEVSILSIEVAAQML